MYKTGDIVKVWSMQSFFGGGFLNGRIAIVRQDQMDDGSVLLIVARKVGYKSLNTAFKGMTILDTAYEVYTQQTEFVKSATEEDCVAVKEFLTLNQKIRSYEFQLILEKKENGNKHNATAYHYAPEFFIDETDFQIKMNKELLLYPELFI